MSVSNLTKLSELSELHGVSITIDNKCVQVRCRAEHRDLVDELVVEASTEGLVSNQVANDKGGVTLTIAEDPHHLGLTPHVKDLWDCRVDS